MLMGPGRDTVPDHGTSNDHVIITVHHELGSLRPTKSQQPIVR